MFAVIKKELVYGPVLKTMQLSAHAQNHASPERCRKSFTMIFLGDHDNRFKFWRVTDRRTDGIAVANTALAMRALRAL